MATCRFGARCVDHARRHRRCTCRAHLVDVAIARWYRCITCCVQRAFLLGEGPLAKKVKAGAAQVIAQPEPVRIPACRCRETGTRFRNRDAINIDARPVLLANVVMPRTARVAPGGFVYHVLNRSAGRMQMFRKSATVRGSSV